VVVGGSIRSSDHSQASTSSSLSRLVNPNSNRQLSDSTENNEQLLPKLDKLNSYDFTDKCIVECTWFWLYCSGAGRKVYHC
jgi:hypothetical protein